MGTIWAHAQSLLSKYQRRVPPVLLAQPRRLTVGKCVFLRMRLADVGQQVATRVQVYEPRLAVLPRHKFIHIFLHKGGPLTFAFK